MTDTTPIRRIPTFSYPLIEARMRTQVRTRNQVVLDRIVMYVIQMLFQILLIADGMFPKTPLPHKSGNTDVK